MQTVLLLASIQAFFLVALLLSKRNKNLSDNVLGGWLGLIGAHTLILYCFAEFQLYNTRLLSFNSGVPFLQGPFLFYYVDTLTSSRIGLKKSYAWHLIPYVAFVTYQLFFQNPVTVTPHDQHVDIQLFDVSFLSNLVLLLSVPFYGAWSLLLLKNYRQRMLNTFSTTDRINLNWLRYLVTAMFLVWLAVLVFVVIQKLTGANSDSGVGHLIFAPISLFVYATGYFGFKQTTIFSNVPEPDLLQFDADATTKIVHPSPADTPDSQPAPKYQKSGLKENEAARTLARLLKHMVEDEPFLDDQVRRVRCHDLVLAPEAPHLVLQLARLAVQAHLVEQHRHAALRPQGVLAVWSASPDKAFLQRLQKVGFEVDEVRVRARGSKGARYIIWFARRGV